MKTNLAPLKFGRHPIFETARTCSGAIILLQCVPAVSTGTRRGMLTRQLSAQGHFLLFAWSDSYPAKKAAKFNISCMVVTTAAAWMRVSGYGSLHHEGLVFADAHASAQSFNFLLLRKCKRRWPPKLPVPHGLNFNSHVKNNLLCWQMLRFAPRRPHSFGDRESKGHIW